MDWKWSNGESYKKSKRPDKNTTEEEQMVDQDEIFSKNIEDSAYSTSLNHDENTWDILNQSIYTQGFRHSNKREELHDKMANRDLIQQIGFNPFLSNQNNYAEDISIRDQFLKPLNTSEEREE